MKKLEADKLIKSILRTIDVAILKAIDEEYYEYEVSIYPIMEFVDKFKINTDPEDCSDYTIRRKYEQAYDYICKLEEAVNERYIDEIVELTDKVKDIFPPEYFVLLEEKSEKEEIAVNSNRITFTWQAEGKKSIIIQAVKSKGIAINWGDGTIEKIRYYGGKVSFNHTYATVEKYVVTIADFNTNCRFLYFCCNNMRLINLDLSGCSKLEWLECNNNQLTDLDVSNCPDLKNLFCENNQLTNLDVSCCLKLDCVCCSVNQLTNLDLSELDLELLHCNNNQLTNLTLTKGSNLKELWCFDNQLTNLDLSNYPKLTEFNYDDNPLKHIMLSDIHNELKPKVRRSIIIDDTLLVNSTSEIKSTN